MNSQTTALVSGLLVALAAALTWWVWSAIPSATAIAAAQTTLPPIPRVNLQSLENQGLNDRTVNGTLPIVVDDGSLGREDPFAGL